jgi:hypothetical protein
MKHRNGFSRPLIVVLLGVVLALMAACTPVTPDPATVQQLAAQEERAAALQQEISVREAEILDIQQQMEEHEGEISGYQAQLAALEEEATELRVQLEALGELGELANLTIILAAQAMPTPTPPPTPTPLPEGVELPPRPEPPAEYHEPVGDFAFYVETLTATGITQYGFGYTAGCALTNTFKRGTKMVWRVEVIDLATGIRVMPADDLTVNVALPHGEERAMRFSQRGGGRVPDAPWMWAASWEIPPDYPVGSLDFSVVVNDPDGRTGTFKMPFSSVQVEIID